MEAWTACPACGEKLEFELDGRALTAGREPVADAQVEAGGHRYRLPATSDLAKVARESDPEIAADRLAEACRVDEAPAPRLSPEELAEIGNKLALADPMAETRLALRCAACGEEWIESLDLGDFLWTEIEARARRALSDVHTLASAYGWTEDRILAMSDTRRAMYTEMVQS